MEFKIGKFSTLILVTVFYCEFGGEYIKQWFCDWPKVPHVNEFEKPLHALVIADIHLLGPIKGHWLDKLYREWHMERAFQTAFYLKKPDVVFVLGDLFDEGDMVDQQQFQNYVFRFKKIFRTSNSVPLISVAGNHDIGFHYKMQPMFTERFKYFFNGTGVNLYTIRDIHFIMINSMALENDKCDYCKAAVDNISLIAKKLNCLKNLNDCKDSETINKHRSYSRPIILQHFPTFRKSDKKCIEHDSDVLEDYRPKWEVISKYSTDWIGELLKPRLALSGHSHNYCRVINRWGVEEYTVASFNWRNKINPSYIMLTITPRDYGVLKCNTFEQKAVIRIYRFVAILCPFFILWNVLTKLSNFFLKKPTKDQKDQ